MQQQKEVQKDGDDDGSESSGPDETMEEFEFQISFENQGIKGNCKYVFIATLGIQSLWLSQTLKQNGGKRVGFINYSKATQSSLASIYENQDCLAIVFNKEIKDYHYNDYNFGQFIIKHIPTTEQTQFIIFTDINTNLLTKKIEIEEIQLRQISNQSENNLKIKYFDSPNEFQGLFADLYSQLIIHGKNVVGIFLVLQEYEAKYRHLEELKPLSSHFGFQKSEVVKGDIVEDIKKLNQTRFKDLIYL